VPSASCFPACHVSRLPLHATAFWYPLCGCGKISVCSSRCLLSCECWARFLLMVNLRALVHWQVGSTTKFSTLSLDASRDMSTGDTIAAARFPIDDNWRRGAGVHGRCGQGGSEFSVGVLEFAQYQEA